MNLTDLTQTAQCKECDGRAYLIDDAMEAPPCPRCSAHPGIDPDNILPWCSEHKSVVVVDAWPKARCHFSDNLVALDPNYSPAPCVREDPPSRFVVPLGDTG